MKIELRPGSAGDAEACGRICFEAFRQIAGQHGFPADLPSAEVGIGLMSMLLGHPGYYSVVAEINGRIAGSNFLDERSRIAGVGPITIDPEVQNSGIGRRLMEDVMERAGRRGFPGVRLLQSTYHNRSLTLYAKLGFEARELVCIMQGPAIGAAIPGTAVRQAAESDVEACNLVCRRAHGHDRAGELQDAIAHGSARVVERMGRLTGYTTGVGFFGHSVGESNDDLKSLIADAGKFMGPGLMVPARNGDLFRWCLNSGLRMISPMTLMSTGLYNEPVGAWMPSVLF